MPLFLTYMMTAVVSSFYIDAFSYVWLQRVVLPETALNTTTRPHNSDALLGCCISWKETRRSATLLDATAARAPYWRRAASSRVPRRLVSAEMDLQTVALDRAATCVRLLNLTGSVGCATPSAGVTVPLAAILSVVDLESLPIAAEAEPHAFLLAPELFTSAVVQRLQSALGPNLAGLLVLHAETQPDGGAATDPAELALGRFQFAIILLDAADSTQALSAVGAVPTNATAQSVVGAAARPLVQLRYPMQARGTARKCLWEGSCLPLGGQSVWGALAMPPTPPMPPQLRDDAGVDAPVVHVRPVVLLAAQMDGTVFFHEAAPAAHAAVAGAVALLGAVAAVSDEPSLRAQLPSLPATPAFALFTGEAWGGLGSRRFARDIASFHCSAPAAVPAAARSTPPPASPLAAQALQPSACYLASVAPRSNLTPLFCKFHREVCHLSAVGLRRPAVG